MAGYHAEDEFTGPAPHRDTQFDTQTLEPPMRMTADRNMGAQRMTGDRSVGAARGGEALSAGYYPPPASEVSNHAKPSTPPLPIPNRGQGPQTPTNPALEIQSPSKKDNSSRHMSNKLVVWSLVLRCAAALSLIVGLAILASNSYTHIYLDTMTEVSYNFSTFTSTKYALGAAIIGAAYSIFQAIATTIRLATGRPLLPGHLPLYFSYIGDQVVIVLLLTGASAAAANFKDLHDLPYLNGISYCDMLGDVCKRGASAIAIIFIGFCFLAASLAISSFCFYKRKT